MAHRTQAHAKVNAGLAVTGRRADGYHELSSVFLRLALHDTLAVHLDDGAARDSLIVDGLALDAGEDNLVLRAVAHLRASIGRPLPPLRFHLSKHIPVAAGLGGGSADAAAALDLAQRAWGHRLSPDARSELALRLGADVPFFDAGLAAGMVRGIGDRLEALPAPRPPAGILLITPPERLSTAAVFATFDALELPIGTGAERIDGLAGQLRDGTDGVGLAASAAMLADANDLWAPASRCLPILDETRAAAEAALGQRLLLSGSGPTLFTIYPSPKAAERAGRELRTPPPKLEQAAIIATMTT